MDIDFDLLEKTARDAAIVKKKVYEIFNEYPVEVIISVLISALSLATKEINPSLTPDFFKREFESFFAKVSKLPKKDFEFR